MLIRSITLCSHTCLATALTWNWPCSQTSPRGHTFPTPPPHLWVNDEQAAVGNAQVLNQNPILCTDLLLGVRDDGDLAGCKENQVSEVHGSDNTTPSTRKGSFSMLAYSPSAPQGDIVYPFLCWVQDILPISSTGPVRPHGAPHELKITSITNPLSSPPRTPTCM